MIACTLSDADRRYTRISQGKRCTLLCFMRFGMYLKRFMKNGVKLRMLLASHNSQWQIKFAGTKQMRLENMKTRPGLF